MATQKPTPAPGKPANPPARDAVRLRSFKEDDFPYIRKASITLAICLALSIAAAGGSSYLLSRQKQARAHSQELSNQASEKYNQAESQKREIRDFQPKYIQLVARGFIGEEKRLDWIESIRKIQEKYRLLPIEYEIFPQQPFQIEATTQGSELELRGSRMLITIQLLHEMDLLNFLHDLKTMQPYALNECTIKPPTSAQNDPLAARLTAECTMYWVTLGKRTEASAEPAKPPGQ